ncbi:MAG: Asp23/Gls24 family envelope stress response protein, partial [Propionibacteriaceae bacterium]
MSTTSSAGRSTTAPGPTSRLANGADPGEMRHRGSTVIADKVFEKVAGQAASEVAASRGRSGGLL